MRILVLIPTIGECQGILGRAPEGSSTLDLDEWRPGAAVALAGFGLAGSGAIAAHHIAAFRPEHVVLAGLAGTYDAVRHPLGAVRIGRIVTSDGIGAGYGEDHRTAHALGFREAPGLADHALTLDGSFRTPETAADLVSVAAISPDAAAARAVRARHPGADLEDMESWAVAIAARAFSVPLTVVRAVSNVAGDRDKSRWRIAEALAGLRLTLRSSLGGTNA